MCSFAKREKEKQLSGKNMSCHAFSCGGLCLPDACFTANIHLIITVKANKIGMNIHLHGDAECYNLIREYVT